MGKATVTGRTEVLASDKTRIGQYDVWITYKTDDGREGMIIVPREGLTEPKIQAEIQRVESERSKLMGKEFTF